MYSTASGDELSPASNTAGSPGPSQIITKIRKDTTRSRSAASINLRRTSLHTPPQPLPPAAAKVRGVLEAGEGRVDAPLAIRRPGPERPSCGAAWRHELSGERDIESTLV